jgi:hypothetical protein
MVGFVDDCNGQTNSFKDDVSDESLQQLINKTQVNAQVRTDMLHASGGALELSKCSCHILQWQFSIQGATVLVPKFPNNDIAQVKVWDQLEKKEKKPTVFRSFLRS